MFNLVILLLLFLVAPVAAFAYLDPGSGAVLINLLIAGVAALIFSFKGLILRLLGKKTIDSQTEIKQEIINIGILSEGRQYYATFLPIIEALIELKIKHSYFTLDIEDEVLNIENEYLDARFLGYGNLGLSRASRLRVENLICTTPNIGCNSYPVKKSIHTKNLIHVFHSINDLSMYKKGSLDHYDTVFMVGDFQTKSIRELEQKRRLKSKDLIALGIPYLDLYQKEVLQSSNTENKKTILVASSWGDKGLFHNYGTDFIKDLAAAGYKVIVRPHPQSYLSELKQIKAIEKDLTKVLDISWDTNISPSASMNLSDLLISDTSSIRFDFAFLYQKPVITLKIGLEAMPGFERDDMSELWMEAAADHIGIQITINEIADLMMHVANTLNDNNQEKISQYRAQTLANFGEAGKSMAQYIADNLAVHI